MRNIVDADPYREECILARPRTRRGLQCRARKELLDLVDDGLHRWQIGNDEVGVNGSPIVRVVVCKDLGFVVDDSVDVNPIGSTISYSDTLSFGQFQR